MQLTYAVTYNLAKQDGTITEGDVAMGKAVAHLTGTYDAHGKVTVVNLKLNGQGMPVDDLEAMLPALGIILPPKASLKGGTMNVRPALVRSAVRIWVAPTVRNAFYGFRPARTY